jgi:hypothetical protein
MMEAEKRGPLFTLVEASAWEFPLAVQKWMLGMGKDSNEVEEAVLKACQAWTNLANQSVERIFQAQGFVGLMTGSVKHLVQCQRVARDFLESLVPGAAAVKGVAGTAEIEQLRESVARLRREVRALTARVNLMDRREAADAELN